jgi:hypothetical protein
MFNMVVLASEGLMGRHKSRRFASLLLVSSDLYQYIHNAHHSSDVVKHHLLSQIILNSPLSDHVYNVIRPGAIAVVAP